MATENEPAKLLLPYLQRADELQKHEPLVAYYCRLYAMERGLRIPQSDRTKTTNALLVSLMKQLEKDKKSLKLGPDDNLHLEGFASSVFAKADKQDRAGQADLNTAKTFYAASIFLEILNQFGELQPDLEQKQKYAAWKAANIRKALKEGRNPLPGPPEEEKDPSFPSRSGEFELEPTGSYSASMPDPCWTTADPTARTQAYDEDTNLQQPTIFSRQPSILSRSPSSGTSPPSHYPNTNNNNYPPPHELPSYYSYPNFQSYPGFTESSLSTAPTTTQHPSFHQGYDVSSVNQLPSNAAPYASSNGTNGIGIVPEAPAASRKYEYDSSYQPLPEKIAEAHKAARFAVGALAFDDVFVAVDHLKKALELLTNPSAGH